MKNVSLSNTNRNDNPKQEFCLSGKAEKRPTIIKSFLRIRYLVINYLLFIISVQFTDIHAQTPEQNLEKYWSYRKRLEEKFVWISECNEPGSNIPVSSISKIAPSSWGGMTMASGEGYVAWDDGNKILPHYIGLLATEYRLLKDNNIDYARTRDELYYALLALERLDKRAETFDFTGRNEFTCGDYRTDDGVFNGFFLRDDVGYNTCQFPIWKNYYDAGWLFKSNMYFQKQGSPTTNSGGLVMSKDVVWNLLNGLALVRALVDDETTYPNIDGQNQTLRQMVKDISLKILDQLYAHGYWKIHHPITSCIINDPPLSGDVKEPVNIKALGGQVAEIPFQYGFCEAIKWINEGDCPYDPGEDAHGGFDNVADLTVFINRCFTGQVPKLYILLHPELVVYLDVKIAQGKAYEDNYKFISLYTVMGGNFDFIINAINAAPAEVRYPYFLLLNQVLHQDNKIYNRTSAMTSFYTWLNHAPVDGPVDYRQLSEPYVSDWGTNNVLTEPVRKGFNIYDCGEYSGIDYMLLHNLFWLVYQSRYSGNSAINKYSVSFDNIIYVNDTYTAGTQVPNAPAVVSNDYVVATNALSSNRDVTYDGRISVKLLPGFKAMSGSKFKAYTSDPDGDCELKYQMIGNPYVPIPPCQSRLKSESNINSDEEQLNQNKEDVSDLVVKIFPNPSSGIFKCSISRYNNQLVTVDIANLTGGSVYKTSLSESEFEIDLSSYPKGLYAVRVMVGDQLFIFKELFQ